jgi:hypothetical protein
MNSKVVKLAVAAVVVAGALAIGVETFRPGQTKKAYAFNAEIQANMALDLDPKAAVPIRDVQPGDFDVTWDSAGGGALKVMPGKHRHERYADGEDPLRGRPDGRGQSRGD